MRRTYMTSKEKAAPTTSMNLSQVGEDLINSMEPGDVATFLKYTNPEKYIQHDNGSPDGQSATAAMFPLIKGKVHAGVARSFPDGEYSIVHADLNMFGKDLVTFQIWRFENGKAVEHWDFHQDKAGPNPSGHTMTDGPREVKDFDKTDANKTLVKKYFDVVIQGGHYDKLAQYNSAANYVQHNPFIADGLDGLQKGLATLGSNFKFLELKKVLGQGNFVLTLSHIQFYGKDAGAVDLFRLESGKIVEHWDVIEPIAPASEWKNTNGMF
jgi:predicted SnoaL-like aldol condensation-catalyzing enzyme